MKKERAKLIASNLITAAEKTVSQWINKIASAKNRDQKNELFKTAFEKHKAELSLAILKSMPERAYIVPVLFDDIADIYGTAAAIEIAYEPHLRGLAERYPSKIAVSFTHGLNEVRIKTNEVTAKSWEELLSDADSAIQRVAEFVDKMFGKPFMLKKGDAKGRFIIVRRSSKKPEQGIWQASFFDNLGATGDSEFSTKKRLEDILLEYNYDNADVLAGVDTGLGVMARMKAKIIAGRLLKVNAEPAAYHGSPHDFDEFSTEKIGTGEGNQSYGWGIYLASKKEIAEWYRDTLSSTPNNPLKAPRLGTIADKFIKAFDMGTNWVADTEIVNKAFGQDLSNLADKYDEIKLIDIAEEFAQRKEGDVYFFNDGTGLNITGEYWDAGEISKGKLYHVDIAPTDDQFLDWDKPLSGQSSDVKNKLITARPNIEKRFGTTCDDFFDNNRKAMILYSDMEDGLTAQEASLYLKSIGIPGIRYLDATSRNAGLGSYNYVVFDEKDVKITKKAQRVCSRLLKASILMHKQKTFKTDEGKFSIYDAEKDPMKVRDRTSMFTVLEDKNGYIVRNAFIPPDLQHQGIATDFYKKTNEESWKKTGKPLRSTRARTLLTGETLTELSADGVRLWDSFVKKGYAEKLGEKDYRFFSPDIVALAEKRKPVQSRLLKASSDTEYLAAVEAGDMAKCQQMVEQAAKAKGYNIGPVYHGTNAEFTEFDITKSDRSGYGKGFYFTPYIDLAESHGEKIMKVFLKIENPVNRNIDHYTVDKNTVDGAVFDNFYVVRHPYQIKSAEPIIYNEYGAVIPLSKRFNSGSNDIRAKRVTAVHDWRYSLLGTTDEQTTCDVCGKVDLHSTMVLLDNSNLDILHCGSTCGKKLLGDKIKEYIGKANSLNKQIRQFIRDSYSNHPLLTKLSKIESDAISEVNNNPENYNISFPERRAKHKAAMQANKFWVDNNLKDHPEKKDEILADVRKATMDKYHYEFDYADKPGWLTSDFPIRYAEGVKASRKLKAHAIARKVIAGMVKAEKKTLHIFDFDGTLADTGEFNRNYIKDAKPIKKNFNKAFDLIDSDQEVIIMTARHDKIMVRDTLEELYGDAFDAVKIIALDDSSKDAKGDYIKKHYSNYDKVVLYDDNKDYLSHAKDILKDEDVEFKGVKASKAKRIAARLVKATEESDQAQRMQATKVWRDIYVYVSNEILQKGKGEISHRFAQTEYGMWELIFTGGLVAPATSVTFAQGGYYGGHTDGENIYIEIYDRKEDTKAYAKWLIHSPSAKQLFLHEMIHVLDKKRMKGGFGGANYVLPEEGQREYFNQPIEYNAYYQEALASIENDLSTESEEFKNEKTKSFEAFYKYVNDTRVLKVLLEKATPDTERKILKRLYRYFKENDPVKYEKEMLGVTAATDSDAEYMAAAEAEDIEKCQAMVDAKAQAEGYTVKAYHGTNASFNTFKPQFGKAIWFSENKDKIARGEAGAQGISKIMPVYLKAQNPAGWPEYDKLLEMQIIQQGYDSVKLDDDWIIFTPQQIKSAEPIIYKNKKIVPLSERFNSNSKDIRAVKASANTLAEEAKKYDTVDDFIKTQAIKAILLKKGIPVNPDDTVTLYHATSSDRAEKILKEGILKGGSTATGGMTGLDLRPSAFLGTNKKWVENTWSDKGGYPILEFNVLVKDIRQPAQNDDEVYFEGGLQRGNDNIWHPIQEPRSTFYDRLAEKQIDKDYLTKIWNEAHKQTERVEAMKIDKAKTIAKKILAEKLPEPEEGFYWDGNWVKEKTVRQVAIEALTEIITLIEDFTSFKDIDADLQTINKGAGTKFNSYNDIAKDDIKKFYSDLPSKALTFNGRGYGNLLMQQQVVKSVDFDKAVAYFYKNMHSGNKNQVIEQAVDNSMTGYKIESVSLETYQITYTDGSSEFKGITEKAAEQWQLRPDVYSVIKVDNPKNTNNKLDAKYEPPIDNREKWGDRFARVVTDAILTGAVYWLGYNALKPTAAMTLNKEAEILDGIFKNYDKPELTIGDMTDISAKCMKAGLGINDEIIEDLHNVWYSERGMKATAGHFFPDGAAEDCGKFYPGITADEYNDRTENGYSNNEIVEIIKIVLVDGNYIRNTFSPDFCNGGTWVTYKFIPPWRGMAGQGYAADRPVSNLDT